MKVRELRKLLVDLDGDVEILIEYETMTSIFYRDCFTAEVKDNGERKTLMLSARDPNEDLAMRATREFMRRR